MLFIKKYEPLLLFLLIVPVLLLRVNIESTQYCTPDSMYYLEVSRNILSGEGFVGPKVFDFNTEKNQLIPLYDQTDFGHPDSYSKEYFAVWPLGYPLCIVATSYLTSLDPLWGSKVLNLLLLALDFYLLCLLFARSSLLPLYYFGSYTMLEICSYTWSENLFLTFFLLLVLCIKKIHQSEVFSVKYILLLAFALIGMSLARYASVIFYVSVFALFVWYFFKKDPIKTKSILTGLVIGSIGLGLYLFHNYLQCGYLTGMPRINTQDFTAAELTVKFFQGIFNQLHIIKQFRISGTGDLLFYLAAAFVQLFLMTLVAFQLIRCSKNNEIDMVNKWMMYTGSLYLGFLVYMTFTSTIDPFDYRTLLPFSFPVFIAVFVETEIRLRACLHTKTIQAIKIFFLFSLVLNLPKKYLLDLLFH